MRRLLISLLLGLSAATVSLTPVAEQLLRLTPARLYFMRAVPDRLDYGIFLALVIVLGLPAGLMHYASFLAPPGWRRVLEVPFGILCVMGVTHLVQLHLSRYPPLLNAVTVQWAKVGVASVDGWFIVSLACGVIVVGVFGCWPWAWMVAKPLLCGAVSVVWLACGLALMRPPAQIPDPRPTEANLHSVREMGSGSPVVWIILDEWDYDLTFRRTDGRTFPQFERLRNQSMFLGKREGRRAGDPPSYPRTVDGPNRPRIPADDSQRGAFCGSGGRRRVVSRSKNDIRHRKPFGILLPDRGLVPPLLPDFLWSSRLLLVGRLENAILTSGRIGGSTHASDVAGISRT